MNLPYIAICGILLLLKNTAYDLCGETGELVPLEWEMSLSVSSVLLHEYPWFENTRSFFEEGSCHTLVAQYKSMIQNPLKHH